MVAAVAAVTWPLRPGTEAAPERRVPVATAADAPVAVAGVAGVVVLAARVDDGADAALSLPLTRSPTTPAYTTAAGFELTQMQPRLPWHRLKKQQCIMGVGEVVVSQASNRNATLCPCHEYLGANSKIILVAGATLTHCFGTVGKTASA